MRGRKANRVVRAAAAEDRQRYPLRILPLPKAVKIPDDSQKLLPLLQLVGGRHTLLGIRVQEQGHAIVPYGRRGVQIPRHSRDIMIAVWSVLEGAFFN